MIHEFRMLYLDLLVRRGRRKREVTMTHEKHSIVTLLRADG